MRKLALIKAGLVLLALLLVIKAGSSSYHESKSFHPLQSTPNASHQRFREARAIKKQNDEQMFSEVVKHGLSGKTLHRNMEFGQNKNAVENTQRIAVLKKLRGRSRSKDVLGLNKQPAEFVPQSKNEPRTSFTQLIRQRREEKGEKSNSSRQDSRAGNIACEDKLSCRGRCTQQREPGPTEDSLQCFCDNECDMFRDCCADYDDHCPANNKTSPASPDVQWQCVSKGWRELPMKEIAGIWMIGSCPRNWPDDKVRSDCLHFPADAGKGYDGDVPVTTSNNKTFKNRFCAQCNGIKPDDMIYYDLYCWKDCKEPEKVNCRPLKWKPANGTHRRYCLNLESSCVSSSMSAYVRYKCENGTFRVVAGDDMLPRSYKNKFCLQCEGNFTYICGPQKRPPNGIIGEIIQGYLLILFKRKKKSNPVTPKHCSDKQVFDSFSQTCRPGVTSSPRNDNWEKLAVAIWMKPQNTKPNRTALNQQHILNSLLANFGIYPSQVFGFHIRKKLNTSIVSFHLDMKWKNQITRNISTAPHSIDSLLNFTSVITVQVATDMYDIYKVTSRLLACIDEQEFQPSEYTVLKSFPPAVYINQSRETFYSYQYFANSTNGTGDQVIPVGSIFVCRQYLTSNCSGAYLSLQEDEYTVFPNGSLYRNISREYFASGSYDERNKTAWICTNYSASYLETRKTSGNNIYDLVLSILSNIGLSLSIFSLVLYLMTYCLFSELRTLPGINVMNLSFSLLLLQSVWFATSQTRLQILCTFIAAFIHYLALVSFTWMSIIAFDTWRAFSNTRIRQQQGSRKAKILRFMAIGWIPALIFVIICVVLDHTQVFNIGYGGENICFIQNSSASMFLLGIPVAISIAFNGFFFVKIVLIIRKIKKQTRAVACQSRNQRNFQLYARLAAITGFTWIFGFLGFLISEYLLYPFVVFTTLQGVYIAAVYVFKTQVKELYMKRFCHKSNNNVSSIVVSNTKRTGVDPSTANTETRL